MQLTGSEIIIECLKEHQVDTVFGYPGGSVLNIYDALYHNQESIKHILTCHEQAAAHAADGYARATGKVGVCLSTSGPGATNLVTGIAAAYMDSIPIVAFTGNVPVALLGKDSFQEVDIAGITMPITKHSFQVKDIKKLASTIRKAFYIAKEGRSGPVLIDLPKDITAQKTEYIKTDPMSINKNYDKFDEIEFSKAIELIEKSKKPFIYSGGGIIQSHASPELISFAEKIQAPVASSMMGLGGFPSSHQLFTGMLGMHGSKTSNTAATECDLLIAIGSRFSDRVTSKIEGFAPKAKIIHIDIDPSEVNKNIEALHSLVGPVKKILNLLTSKLKNQCHQEWLNYIFKIKKDFPLTYRAKGSLSPQYVVEKIGEIAPQETIITTEVGQNQIWAAQFFPYSTPRTFISSGGLGAMGFGLGASIGAQVGCPHKRVFNIAGDGSFHMNCNELATVVKYQLPIIIVILNNQVLGMVRQWQNLFYEKRFAETTLNRQTDIVKLAEAFGAVGYNITANDEVEATLKKALTVKGPVVINCVIHPDEMVFPMVAPGKEIMDLILNDDYH